MIIVLDTETCGSFAKPLVYDLGYCVVDETTGEVIKERSYIIKQTFNDEHYFETAYYKEKRPIYEEYIENGLSKLVWLGFALRQLKLDIEKYEIDEIYAYNSRFDKNSISKTIEEFNSKYNPTENGIEDIMDYIKPITNTIEYYNYCVNNGFMTKHKTPRPQRKAETLYSYLINNPNYKEEHTALQDSLIELFILRHALSL